MIEPLRSFLMCGSLISLLLFCVNSFAQTDPASCDCNKTSGACSVSGQITHSDVLPTPPQECGAGGCAPFKMNWTFRVRVVPAAQCAAAAVSVVVSGPEALQALKSQDLSGIFSVYRRIVTDGQLDIADSQIASVKPPASGVRYAGEGTNWCHLCPLKDTTDISGAAAAAAAASTYNASQGVSSRIGASVASTTNPSCYQTVLTQVDAISARYKNVGGNLCNNYRSQAEMYDQMAGAAASCSDVNAAQLAAQSRTSASQARKAATQICAH